MTPPLHLYPAYKPSANSWIGDVPLHWDMLPLKHAVQVNPEILPEDTDPGYRFDYVDINSVGAGYLVTHPIRQKFGRAPSRARRVVRRGDTAISTVRTYLKATYHLKSDWPDLIASTGFAVLRPPTTIVPELIGHIVQSTPFVGQVMSNSVGVAYPAISETKLGTLVLPLPPLLEQRAIVRYLDYVDRRIRRCVVAKRKLIALLEEEREAVVNRAVTRGLDPNVDLKPSGVEWLGEAPEHWRIMRARFLFKEVAKRSTTGEETHLSMSQELGLVPSHMVEQSLISESYVGGKLCRENDLVLNRLKAHLGVFALGRQAGVVSPDYSVFRKQDCINMEYFLRVLRLPALRTELRLCAKGIVEGFWRLYTKDFYNIQLPVPSLAEQQAIIEYLDKATADIDTAIARAHRQIELLQEYRTRLIADVVTGKLDVRATAAQLPDEYGETDPRDGDGPMPNNTDNGTSDGSPPIEEEPIRESEVTA